MPSKMSKPKQWGTEYGSIFQDQSVVEAYQFRPMYPPGTFRILRNLVESTDKPWRVLDAGCGTGFVAREIAPYVDAVDAVDVSEAMIERGKTLPGGDAPQLRWISGPIEEVPLRAPYSLVVAAESLHWMEWERALPRFAQILQAPGYLAIVDHVNAPNTWDGDVRDVFAKYSMNQDFQRYTMMTVAQALAERGLFEVVGTEETEPMAFRQSIDAWIESVHASNGFSRDRMAQSDAEACDEQLRAILWRHCSDGIVERNFRGRVIWGKPKA